MACLSRLCGSKNLISILKATTPISDVKTMTSDCKKVTTPTNCESIKKNAFKEDKPKPTAVMKCMHYNKVQEDEKFREFRTMERRNICCPCPDIVPRSDDEHYRITDKAKRLYQQTWHECPELRIVKRAICCYEKFTGTMPMQKRERKARKPQTATPQSKASTEFMKCATTSKSGSKQCPTVCMPAPCKCGRVPPKCKPPMLSTGCIRVCAPYPSFSECKRDHAKRPRPTECGCLKFPTICELMEIVQKQQAKRK